MVESLPERARKGRGAVTNRSGRFEAETRVAVDDGWGASLPENAEEEDPPPLRTTLMPDSSREIIARNQSPDVPFDRSINPYRGCEHGCVYCFARPTHAYLGFSAGLGPRAPDLELAVRRLGEAFRAGHDHGPHGVRTRDVTVIVNLDALRGLIETEHLGKACIDRSL